MRPMIKKIALIIAAFGMLSFVACSKDSETSEHLDKATEETKDAAESTGEAIKKAAETAGTQIKDAAEESKEFLEKHEAPANPTEDKDPTH